MNRRGGIDIGGTKHKIELATLDDRSDKTLVPRVYETLIKDEKVDIVFGPFGSTLTAAANTTEQFGKFLVIWSASADKIYEQGYKYVVSATQIAASRLGKPGADAMGVNVTLSRLKAWLMSALFASWCGGVLAWFTGALDPITAFDVLMTAKTVIYAMAGGLGTVTGPVVGTVILVWVDELIWRQFPVLNNFLLGFIIALLILFMPRGIIGTLMQRYPQVRRLIL